MSSSTPPPLPPYRQPLPPLAPPRSRTWFWLAIVGGVGFVTMIVLGLAFVYHERALPAREDVSTEEKHRQTKDAFGAGSPADDRETRDISTALDRLNAALVQHNSLRVADAFDTDRMCDELDRLGIFSTVNAAQKAQTITTLRNVIPNSLVNAAELAWKSHKLRKVVISSNRREAVVYDAEVRTIGTIEYSTKFRWWLRRSGSSWKAWDFESLEDGLRMTSLQASLIRSVGSNNASSSPLLVAVQQIRVATKAMQDGEMDKADAALDKLNGMSLPSELTTLREFCVAAVRLRQRKYAETIKHCDVIAATGRDFPGIHEFRTMAYNRMGQSDNALKSAHDWEDALGGDREVYFEMGTALSHLNRPAEAVDAFRKSLDEDADAAGALAELTRVLPAGHKTEIAERFAQSKNHAKVFFAAVSTVQHAKDLEGMQILIDAYRADTASAQDPWLTYYDAELKILRRHPKEAEALLKSILPLATQADRHSFVTEYIYAAQAAGDTLEAYSVAPDPVVAFKLLAARTLIDKDTRTLQELVTRHLKRFASDPWVHYYQAKTYEMNGKPQEADAAYGAAAALAKPGDMATFRTARVSARFDAGQGLSAYRDLKPQDQVFLQLARLYMYKKQGAGLAELVAARKADAPSDRIVPLWDAQARFFAGDYTSAVSILSTCRPAEDDYSNHYMWSNLYIRSQTRLKHFAEARQESNRAAGAAKNLWHVAIVECAAGNVAAGADALNTLLKNEDDMSVSEFYEDPDIGPALAAPGFADWRKAHPIPVTQPSTQPTTEAGN